MTDQETCALDADDLAKDLFLVEEEVGSWSLSAKRDGTRIHQIIASAATGSAHHQPKRLLSKRPASSTADM